MRVLLLLLCLLTTLDVSAHRFAPSLLEVKQLSAERFSATWKTPAQKVSATPIEPRFPDHCNVLSTSPWVQEGTGLLMQLQLECPGGLVGHALAVSGLGENQSSALLRVHLAEEIFHQAVFTAAEPQFVIPEEGSPGAVALDYSWLGAEHIWAGPDHLLFVMGLLLLVGGGRRLVFTVTAFTVGHSVTLAMVTLGVFDYPVSLVEFLIAVSISCWLSNWRVQTVGARSGASPGGWQVPSGYCMAWALREHLQRPGCHSLTSPLRCYFLMWV